jgi:cytochrome P450
MSMEAQCPHSPPELRELIEGQEHALLAREDFYAELRELGPVVWIPELEAFAVTRSEEIREVLADPKRFSSQLAADVGAGPRVTRRMMETRERIAGESPEFREIVARLTPDFRTVPILTRADPPRHQRHRRWVNKLFMPNRVATLEDNVRTRANALIDSLIDRDHFDINKEFSVPLPVQIIAEQLGVTGTEHLTDFARWSDDFNFLVGRTNPTDEDIIRIARTTAEFSEYFTEVFSERAKSTAGDDFISTLAQMEDPVEPVSNIERVGVVAQLVIGGNQTTTKLLTSGVDLLARSPDLAERLRADSTLVPGFVEEVLRLRGPIQGAYRVARHDTEIAGIPIPAGASVLSLFASGDRADSVFPEPTSVVLDRSNARDHLAFGRGVHYCVGAPLARLEGTVGFTALLQRLWPWSVETSKMTPSYLFHGLSRLEITLETPHGQG